MTCRYCTGHHPTRIDAYPAGNPRASLVAAHSATEARTDAPGPVHQDRRTVHSRTSGMRAKTTNQHPH
ncbi:hypothetical protein [Streptomyces sp. NPDC018059]|uniref:hypothetical protein n=1 Tax=Streptomyces sp. NPDC018059 TaxID=3365041 RepID=UPI00379A94D3